MKKKLMVFIGVVLMIFIFLSGAFADLKNNANSDEKTAKDYVDQGISYRASGDNKNAIMCFTKAIEIDPNYAEAYESRGLSYGSSQVSDFDKALVDFNKAIELDPKNGNFYFGRALVYYYKNNCYKSSSDTYKAKQLGFVVPLEFIKELNSKCGKTY